VQSIKDRLHILDGFKIATQNIEKVLFIINDSENVNMAKKDLIKTFDFSTKQTNAILKMSLGQINIEKINNEYEKLQEDCKYLSMVEG